MLNELFRKFSTRAAQAVGSAYAFIAAILFVCVWAFTGPLFRFSDTWQLIINTSTTIMTFLMVFLIQNTQNRDAKALHLKLDELIKSSHRADNKLLDLDNLSDEQLKQLEEGYKRVCSAIGEEWDERKSERRSA